MDTPGQDRLERRLAAILAADVAGYSRLTGQDEEGTHARLQSHLRSLVDPKIAEYRGRIVKNTGDGLLAEFSSVVDAVRCAVDVQRGMGERNANMPEPLEFRIGINVGDVILDRGDIFGDGVNVAARLEGVAEPGGVCMSWDAYRQVKGKVDIAVVDLGEQRLKNIAEPVRVFAIRSEKLRTLAIPFPASRRNVTRPPRLSLVVLPFANLGKGDEQDYLVDAITENLSIELSRIRGAFVVASHTAFTYKEKRSDVRQIGRELGVGYAVEGSVQPGADRLRVNAQLIDAESGAYLWAERYDKPRADLFAMQDEITSRLARALGVELVAAESRRTDGKRPEDLDAIDLCMRGHAIRNQPYSRERASQARELFEAAHRLDDQNVDALIHLSIIDSTEVINFISSDPAEQIRLAKARISKALVLAPYSAHAHYAHARVLYAMRELEASLRECELALSLDRNFAWAHAWTGYLKISLGRAEETAAHVSEAMRLSPRDPRLGAWFIISGIADLYLSRLNQAVDDLRKAVHLSPSEASGYFFLASALSLLGREREAAEVCAAGRNLSLSFTISNYKARAMSDDATMLAQRKRVIEGMRRAGVPE